MIVAHCPGHGIRKKNDALDLGCEHNGIIESGMTLGIARLAAQSCSQDIDHRLLRTLDVGPSYERRGLMAAEMKADIVICHHINAFHQPSAHGLITFYDEGDLVGREVAEAIERAAPKALLRSGNDAHESRPGEWTKNAHWVLNHYRRHQIPAALVEWGFASNVDDAEFLKDESSDLAITACAMAGIARVFELLG